MRTVESWLEIAENALKAAINANSLNNIKQNEMKRDEIVEKIKKIKGVKQVTYNDEQAVVQFEKEVELVEGEIYVSTFIMQKPTIFRKGHSTLDTATGDFFECEKSDIINYHAIKPAPNKQKKKLIKAEIKNGFFFELLDNEY